MSRDIFGPLIATVDVERAVLATTTTWLDYYLDELEAKAATRLDLPRPPAPESYAGGMDFEGWQQDSAPAIIAVCKPIGEPELTGAGDYNQWYEIQLGAVVIGDDEDSTRVIASYYGVALTAIGAQQGAFGGMSSRTRLIAEAAPEFQDPDVRDRMQAVATFHAMISPSLNENGPQTVPAKPGTQVGPTVTSTHVTVIADPLR